MNETDFKRTTTAIILIILTILSFFLLKPILLSIIVGILLAFIFTPIYNWINKGIKNKTFSAVLISIVLILLILLPVWFLTPIAIDQSIKIYFATQKIDFTTPLKTFFPKIFASEDFSREIGSIIYSFVNNSVNSLANSLSRIIFDFPVLFLQSLVAFFTFFFILRDKEKFIDYIKSLLPFSKDVEKKLFEQTKGITISVLYGQLIIGLIQGLIAGAGFFIFGVPNALLLTLFACLAGIFPIVGTTIVWVPAAIYLIIAGNPFSAIGVSVFGLIATFIDNILKPMFVSQRTSMPTSVILIGMIGGFFLFGVLGFILGPLILAYLLIILEIYRNKKVPGILIQESASKPRINI